MKQIQRYQQIYFNFFYSLKKINHKPTVRLVTIPYK